MARRSKSGRSGWSELQRAAGTIAAREFLISITILIPVRPGCSLEADTTTQTESVIMEVDFSGTVLKTWNPGEHYQRSHDGRRRRSQSVCLSSAQPYWFHNNAAYYNRADNSLIVSSRENFVIGLDYDTRAIKWILGDQTEEAGPVPVFEAICTHPRPRRPAADWTPCCFDYSRLGPSAYDNGFPSLGLQPPGAHVTLRALVSITWI